MIARRHPAAPGKVTTPDHLVTRKFAVPDSRKLTMVPLEDFQDEQLVAHADREAAFSILYDRYTPSILGY
jgi:hypothetical protein